MVMDAGNAPPGLGKIFTSERAAREHINAICWQGRLPYCPRCREEKVYTLSNDRFRCSRCKYTFRDLSLRWINNGGLSSLNWLKLVHGFALEKTTHQLAEDLGLSYNATYKAVTALRFALMCQAPDAKQLLGPETGLGQYLNGQKLTGSPGGEKNRNIPVFGILERNGWVFIDLVPGIQAETIFHFNVNFHLKVVRMGNIIYTDKYKSYDALILCGDDSLPYDYIRLRKNQAYIDSTLTGFWPFARDRFKQYKGVSTSRFPLYLKELEFRYNHKNQDIFHLLLNALCSFVPTLDE